MQDGEKNGQSFIRMCAVCSQVCLYIDDFIRK